MAGDGVTAVSDITVKVKSSNIPAALFRTCYSVRYRIKKVKNLEIGVSTKLIVTARIWDNVLREKKILKKRNFEEKKL